jgi:ATP-dependent RNA helicase RhlE
MSFEVLNLHAPLLNALSDLGLTEPTPIQQKVFSVVMSGRDVVGIAQTGTGKTYAYLLPILRKLKFSAQRDPRVLIVVPTRELVIQLVGEIEKLTPYMNTRFEGVYGGTNINTQKLLLVDGVDILVATPGRLIDLVLSRAVTLRGVRTLVIDEVDEMFNLGFRTQLTTIFDMLPRRRQNLMFSATMPEAVDDLIEIFFNEPMTIEATRAGTPLERIVQHAYQAPNFHTKINLLERLLETDADMKKVLIFGPSKRLADQIFEQLDERFPGQFGIIHADKSQNFRINAVQKFEDGGFRGLIATDLLARGLDVTDVTHVINVDTPTEPETYIHRIGRTGRADKDGAALVFFTEAEKPRLEAIENLMKKEIPKLTMPEDLPVSDLLIMDERTQVVDKNPGNTAGRREGEGAFHKKLQKNMKVNLGNDRKRIMAAKYKKPIKKGVKRK